MPIHEYLCEACQKPNRKRYKSTRPKPRFCNNECTRKAAPWLDKIRKYTLTEDRRQALLELDGKRLSAARIIQDPRFAGIPKRVVWEWRSKLGLSVSRDARPWEAEEVALLEKYSHNQAPWISMLLRRNGFSRTDRAVAAKLRMLRLNTNRMAYSARRVAEYFHCHADTVVVWIQRGYLKAQNGGNQWLIEPGDLAQFVRERPLLLNPFRPDVLFLISLLDNYRARPRRARGDGT